MKAFHIAYTDPFKTVIVITDRSLLRKVMEILNRYKGELTQ